MSTKIYTLIKHILYITYTGKCHLFTKHAGPSTQYMVDASCIQIKPGGKLRRGGFGRQLTVLWHYTTTLWL